MTNEADGTGPKEPPKINIGLTDGPDRTPDKPKDNASESAPAAAPPPKFKFRPAQSGNGVKKSETAPIEAPKPVPQTSTEPPTASADNEEAPTVAPTPPTEEPKAAETVAESPLATPPKGQPLHIDDLQEESLDDLYKAALNATQRVILDEQRSGDTGKIPPADESQLLKKAEVAESAKKSTARLDLQELLSEDERKDLQPKHETLHIGSDGTPKPKSAGTLKVEKPVAEEAEHAGSVTMPIPMDLEESKKSETARIDLPREVVSQTPPTQRKTIRIKRPEAGGAGGTRPALSIARPPAGEKRAATSTPGALKLDSEESSVHPAFAAVALIAVLVSLAVVYVLAATFSPAVPFPGRLI